MREVLLKLRESIEISENLIQFKIGEQFYELEKLKNGEWILFTLFGKELNINLKKLNGLDRFEVEEYLKQRFKNIEIY